MVVNSKTSGKFEERSQPRPQILLIGKREDPGVEGEILVPDLTLTANFKMAAKEIVCYTAVFSVVTQRSPERCVTTLKTAV